MVHTLNADCHSLCRSSFNEKIDKAPYVCKCIMHMQIHRENSWFCTGKWTWEFTLLLHTVSELRKDFIFNCVCICVCGCVCACEEARGGYQVPLELESRQQ